MFTTPPTSLLLPTFKNAQIFLSPISLLEREKFLPISRERKMNKKLSTNNGAEENGGGWKDIPAELLASIVVKMPPEEMMRVVPLVCKNWFAVVCGPYCWKNIDLRQWSRRHLDSDKVDAAVEKLVGYSMSTFQRLSTFRLGNAAFSLAANSARCLKILTMPLSNITDQTVISHAESLTTLTHLDISYCAKISYKAIEAFGKHCKSLIYLKRDMSQPYMGMSVQETSSKLDESEAMAIADTMPQLQHLELCYGTFSSCGLDSLVTKCKALTFLNIEGCWSVKFDEALKKQCEKIEVFRGPWDDDDIELVYEISGSDFKTEKSSEDDFETDDDHLDDDSDS